MPAKNILGLDLGTTSIGFAKVVEDDHYQNSAVELIGVRVNPLTTDEQTNFEKGKPVSVNADRTLKRGMRRNLDRYQLRRNHLIKVLQEHHIIAADTKLAEDGKNTTHATYASRALAATAEIPLDIFARVLLTINKKRGYKSSRKAKNEEEGQLIDGMAVARRLYEECLTPGQLSYQLLKEGKKYLPDFYRSDLNAELDKVWNFQRQFYPDILTEEFKKHLEGKGQRATSAAFWGQYGFNTAENKGGREEKKLKAYQWRSEAVQKQLVKEEVAYMITEINNDLNKSSGYLGAISDRSKELFFNKQTVGQYLYGQLKENPHTRLKGQVFYRQDYLDEFETIWETQARFHPELTPELKEKIRDVIIFYQRKLKSQKGLISFCEFESKETEVEKNGRKIKQRIGLRVAPKSSPLFQEFKIWQVLNNLEFRNKNTKEVFVPDITAKQQLFDELNIKGNLLASEAIKMLGYKTKDWEANYHTLEGNRTNKSLYDAYLKILELEGYDENLLKLSSSDDIDVSKIEKPALEIKQMVHAVFEVLGIDSTVLDFDAEADGKAFEQQPAYQLWHLLYSAEDDNKKHVQEDIFTYGRDNIGLKKKLCEKLGFKPEHTKILVNVAFSDDYGGLSSKAIRRIYPFIKELTYDKACAEAGYRHSASALTKEEIATRPLQKRLNLLKKNELRSPVVEKILNQMINVVNTLIDDENTKRKAQGVSEDFHFDEIRIELARELKKNARERAEMTTNINAAKQLHEKIIKILQTKFGVPNPSRNDIIRYKLYEELKNNGYKDLYTNTYISPDILFSKQIDVDHIIPQMSLFDDSFSNKTVVFRKDNQDKGNKTAYDYLLGKYGERALEEYISRISSLFELGKKNKEEGISKAKFQKLQKRLIDIGDGFIERDLRESQYIAKKAKHMLYAICRSVVSTSGEITARLREDWDLVNVMQEINLSKFRTLGLTEMIEKKDGGQKERITDWTKRNDHRHHAMDALTIAFTRHSHIQYLNHLNARKDEVDKWHPVVSKIEEKETDLVYDDLGNRKRKFKAPMLNFREVVKEHLENVLISHKAKNKVFTKNKNKIKTARGEKIKTELTPRGQLHKETVYGRYRYYESKEEKIGTKFNEGIIRMVVNPQYRKLLLERLVANENDPQKAFGGKNALSKNPIYIDEVQGGFLPEKVLLQWQEYDYSIRKDITPENLKDVKAIEKVLDEGVKKILLKRLADFGDDPKKAFSDLDKKPIWQNEAKGIAIRRVTISGVKNAAPLHHKQDHLGKDILDENGKQIPSSFVSTGNNHHVAIYRDVEGNLQERVVSLFDAVQLVNAGEAVIDKEYNKGIGWQFLFTMKQNEMFVFPDEKTGFNPKEIDLLDLKNRKRISPNLFRVQKLATKNYMFRHHFETTVEENKKLFGYTYKHFRSTGSLEDIVKVRINHIGEIVSVGEY
ncbi:type II CRISPR RNA-guided endonuclease Cas9 [Niabella drilacis]|uniref:CRISPR-associated endonuclease Cas9 n=1 Tax=Niabella drilacis (strain DSM 25811 / CCM 8410 / CCUG 62505 / LMG 26954 / E90) TaxID=1285928 RepID=A0A1G6UPQ0_NIADE|nr:type II CRISPR RNA-guided endonuclease Cas9 [Niabella drilacis]SDD42535.1 CRISPR-associated endonuclease Csn1 [Niabella drilacis]